MGALLALGGAGLALLGPYSTSLVTIGGDPELSNLSPPSVVLASTAARKCSRSRPCGRSWPEHSPMTASGASLRWWAQGMGIYLWHIPLVGVAAGIALATGWSVAPLSLAWWLVHVAVVVVVVPLAWLIAGVAARGESRSTDSCGGSDCRRCWWPGGRIHHPQHLGDRIRHSGWGRNAWAALNSPGQPGGAGPLLAGNLPDAYPRAGRRPGPGVQGEAHDDHRTPTWVDLACSDVAAESAFYAGLLGWEYREAHPDAGGWIQADVEGQGQQDWPPATPARRRPSDDLLHDRRRGLSRRPSNPVGATTLAPPMRVDIGGEHKCTIAVLADPSGAAFGLMRNPEPTPGSRCIWPGFRRLVRVDDPRTPGRSGLLHSATGRRGAGCT